MLKKLRSYFGGNLEPDSKAKKRIKQKQQELALRLKSNLSYQQAVFSSRADQLDLG